MLEAINNAYDTAFNHCFTGGGTAHIGCSVVVNGRYQGTFSNSTEKHAEKNALASDPLGRGPSGSKACFEGGHQREKGGPRLRRPCYYQGEM